jgi:hypothetical protein
MVDPRRLLGSGLIVLFVVGCHPGASVRERIMAVGSPLVGDSYSYEAGPLGGANVTVALLPTTTVADAKRFWCDVVVPAGGTHDGSGVKVTLYIQGGSAGFGPVAEDATCPVS